MCRDEPPYRDTGIRLYARCHAWNNCEIEIELLDRTYRLRAASEDEREEWIAALHAAGAAAKLWDETSDSDSDWSISD